MYIVLCTLKGCCVVFVWDEIDERRKMNTTKTLTLDEIRKLSPLSEEEISRLEKLEAHPDEENPELTPEQLASAKPAYIVHPEWFRPKKVDVHLKIDVDVLEAFKAQGKGYQTRINEVLRRAVFST